MGSWWFYNDAHVKAATIAGIVLGLSLFVIRSPWTFILMLGVCVLLFVILFGLFALVDTMENWGILRDIDLEERGRRVDVKFGSSDQRIDRDEAAYKRQAKRFDNIDRFGTVTPPRVEVRGKKKKKGKIVHNDGLPF